MKRLKARMSEKAIASLKALYKRIQSQYAMALHSGDEAAEAYYDNLLKMHDVWQNGPEDWDDEENMYDDTTPEPPPPPRHSSPPTDDTGRRFNAGEARFNRNTAPDSGSASGSGFKRSGYRRMSRGKYRRRRSMGQGYSSNYVNYGGRKKGRGRRFRRRGGNILSDFWNWITGDQGLIQGPDEHEY